MNYLVAVDTFFCDRPTGAGRVAWDIAQVMRDRGNKVSFLCRKQDISAEDVSEHDGVSVVRFAFPKTFSADPLKVYKQKKAGFSAASKYLAYTDWDLIHIHMPLFGKIAYEAFGKKPRYVYTVHSPTVMEQEINWLLQGLSGKIKWIFGKGLLKEMEGGLLRKVERIQTLSNFTKERIDEYYGVGNKVTVIPHWCRKDMFRVKDRDKARQILGWPIKGRIIFSVRRLFHRMGIDVAIKALAPLFKSYSNINFALAGSGVLEQPLKELACSLGVEDKVWFLGKVSDEMLKRCYEASDLFLLPTSALECFGLPILEALAYGLPIISTDAAAIPELMRPILPKCIVKSGNVEMLRQKVKEYLGNRLELPSSEEMISYVKQNFDSKIIIPKIISFLEN